MKINITIFKIKYISTIYNLGGWLYNLDISNSDKTSIRIKRMRRNLSQFHKCTCNLNEFLYP